MELTTRLKNKQTENMDQNQNLTRNTHEKTFPNKIVIQNWLSNKLLGHRVSLYAIARSEKFLSKYTTMWICID